MSWLASLFPFVKSQLCVLSFFAKEFEKLLTNDKTQQRVVPTIVLLCLLSISNVKTTKVNFEKLLWLKTFQKPQFLFYLRCYLYLLLTFCICFTQFNGSSYCLNFSKFRDAAPLTWSALCCRMKVSRSWLKSRITFARNMAICSTSQS